MHGGLWSNVPLCSHRAPDWARECLMNEQRAGEFVERVRDQGQWFDRGMRAEFFRVRPAHVELERAALGSYEVLGCERVEDADGRWLDVTLRSTGQAMRAGNRRS